MNAPVRPLLLADTVEVSRVNHRLALGVQWLDALTRLPAGGALFSELESIGARPLVQGLERHPLGRHALRWAGRLAKLLKIAAAEKIATPPATPDDDQTLLALRCFAQREANADRYHTDRDPRHHVPRRLALLPQQSGGEPPADTGNIRHAWLWPGANYPLGANTTAIRGRVRQGATLADSTPVPWTRVVVTLPANIAAPADFDNETKVGWGHGDDRGEFLVVLGVDAVPGGATLPTSLPLRVWVFLPPATTSFDAASPLESLPLEYAGIDTINDVLRGLSPPADYVRQAAIDFPLPGGETVRPGAVCVMNDAVLLFP